MKSPKLDKFLTSFSVSGDNLVEKVQFVLPSPTARKGAGGEVHINPKQYFGGVPEEVWNFKVGGYQVCDKWLKDRKGRRLSADDIAHYQRIVVAFYETMRIMRDIDKVIPKWPIS